MVDKLKIISVFDSEESLIPALEKIREKNITIEEVYTPYPIHEVMSAVQIKTRFALAAFLAGFIGAVLVLAFLYYTSVISWPLNYGGKPFNSFPSFIVVTLIMTILITTLASLFFFSVRAKIYPGKKSIMPDIRSTDDKFVVVIDIEETSEQKSDFILYLKEIGASEVHEKYYEIHENYFHWIKNKLKWILGFIVMPLILMASCDRTRNQKGYEYFPDMAHSLTYETYSKNPNFLDGKTDQNPVKGTIPREMIPFNYPATATGRELAGKNLKNPLPLNDKVIGKGKELYKIYCTSCHGSVGDGEGFLYTSGKYTFKPASLISEKMMKASAGEIYQVITVGFGLMGPHRSQIIPEDRWYIVKYVEAMIQIKQH